MEKFELHFEGGLRATWMKACQWEAELLRRVLVLRISRSFVPLGGSGGEWLKKLLGGVRWLPLLKTSARPGRVLSQRVIH